MTAVTSSLDLSELHLRTVKPVTRALYVAAIAAFLALGLVTRSSAAQDYDTALVQELHRMWKAGFGVHYAIRWRPLGLGPCRVPRPVPRGTLELSRQRRVVG